MQKVLSVERLFSPFLLGTLLNYSADAKMTQIAFRSLKGAARD